MPDDPIQLAGGDEGDPYLAWARAQHDAQTPAADTPAPAPQLDANVPGLGVPAAPLDAYAAWARTQPQPEPTDAPVTAPAPAVEPGDADAWRSGGAAGPVTSPDRTITSPEQMGPAGPGPRTPYGSPDVLEGNVDPMQRRAALDAMSPQQLAAAVDSMSPEEKLRYETQRTRAMMLKQAELEHTAAAESERRAREDVEMQRASVMKADADTREMLARADQLANTKIDPNRYSKGLGTAGRIGTVLMSVLGGAFAENTGGHNLALDQFNKQVDNDIAAQHADLANAWRGVDNHRYAIASEYDRHGDLYKAQETYRQAAYMSAINDMQSQLQNYDPAGGTALAIRGQIDQFRQTQQQNAIAFHQQQLKNTYDAIKADKDVAETAKIRAETAKLLGGLGAGTGGATNPNYTVATGFFNPFTNEPILGKRQIGGKGEDPKERNQVDAQISTYAHVQDYWQKLAAIGNEIGNAKTAGESVWKARKSTLASEYDTAREALTVYLTKELGDKLTQGQLEAQAHRIPERASLFEARDPAKQIADAQADADRDFARDMNIPGIDATPIIKAAQARRGNVRPSAEQAMGDAQAAVAADPTNKDAQAALASAHQRVQAEVGEARTRKVAIATVASIQTPPVLIPVATPNPEFRTDEYTTAGKEANLAIDRYGALLRKFHDEASSKADEGKLGKIAAETLNAKHVAEDKAHEFAQEQHLRELYERTARTNAMIGAGRGDTLERRMQDHPGVDPTIDVSRAAPREPGAVPGVDELLPPGSSYRPPKKKAH